MVTRQHSCALQAAMVQSQAAGRATAAAQATLAVLRDQQQTVTREIAALREQLQGMQKGIGFTASQSFLPEHTRQHDDAQHQLTLARERIAHTEAQLAQMQHVTPPSHTARRCAVKNSTHIVIDNDALSRSAAAKEDAARLEAEADSMDAQAALQRQELHRLRMALQALCSTTTPTSAL